MHQPVLPDGTAVVEMRSRRLAWGLPLLSTQLVLRRRFFPKLDTAGHGGVAVVSGPPGYGKSALVSGWARYADPGEVLWLSLSPDDSRHPNLWSRVRTEVSGFTGGDFRTNHPVILVVDNVEIVAGGNLVDGSSLADGMVSMMEELVGNFGLIIIGRSTAHLPLHRLGMRTDLMELEADELALTEDEVAELLRSWQAQAVPAEQVRELTHRSEGWVAGVRLATLTINGRGASSSGGNCMRTDRGLIADYFEKEIFERQSPAVRDFLSRTAVLDDLTAGVCKSVSGRQDALQILESLARENLFVRRVAEADTFRYHGLFREFLLHQLALSGLETDREARVTAARCLEANGNSAAARTQLLAAGAYDELFTLGLRNTLEAADGGRPASSDLMLPAGVPDGYFERSPLRMYPLCVSHLARLQTEKAEWWLRRMELALGTEWTGASSLRARCHFLWAVHAMTAGDVEGMLRHLEASGAWTEPALSAELYDSLGRDDQWIKELDAKLALLAPMLEAQAELWLGRSGRAAALLSSAYGTRQPAEDPVLAGVLGEALRGEGRLRQAQDVLAAGLAHAERVGVSDSPATLGLRLALARVMYERDDIGAVEEQLSHADRICREAGQEAWRPAIECELARVDMSHGRLQEALQRLNRLEAASSIDGNIPLRQQVYDAKLRCQLATGDLLGAEDLIVGNQGVRPSSELLARFHLATGRPDRASAEVGRSGFTARGRPSVERLLLQTRVFLQAGNRREAEHSLQRAVNLARGDRLVRVFLDEPKQIVDLLRALFARGTDGFVDDILARLPAGSTAVGGSPHPFILEPLTERERELLSYLPGHLSQSEIASRMFISANTVKTHMKGLYRKLGASSRSEAVDIARDCGLLSPAIGV